MIPKDIENKLEDLGFGILNPQIQHGGDINSAAVFESNNKKFFIKWNNAERFPEMFKVEAKGLKLLSDTQTINVPEVILFDETNGFSFLVLNFIEPLNKSKDFYSDFGRALANLHRTSDEKFGLDYDNYIGSLKQINKKKGSWTEFFIENRLEYQLKIAFNKSIVEKSLLNSFSKLFSKLVNIFPIEKPSLIHGDLWGGNYLVSITGAAIIDPAVYYGHREMDLGMSKLFGGFDPEFYSAYNEEFPLEIGWQERIEICNLYPLLVHVNLFGGGYLSQIKNILGRFA